MFKKCLIVILIVGLTSCRSTRKTVSSIKTLTTANIHKTITKADTTIVIPTELIGLKVTHSKLHSILSDSIASKVFTQTKGRAKVTLTINKEGVYAEANCDSIVKTFNIYKEEHQTILRQVKEEETIITKKQGYSFLQVLLYVLIVAVISFITGYLFKHLKQ